MTAGHRLPKASRPHGNGVALWFEIDDFDDAVGWAEALGAEVVLPARRNPPGGPGGPAHREVSLPEPDGSRTYVRTSSSSAHQL